MRSRLNAAPRTYLNDSLQVSRRSKYLSGPEQYASNISTTLIDTQIINRYIAIGSDLIVIFWLNVDEVLSLLVLVLSPYTLIL